MDKVIAGYVHQMKKKSTTDETDRSIEHHSIGNGDVHKPITVGPHRAAVRNSCAWTKY
ncbi:hypothetical protein CBL_20759 [Carabus blaptoides fortunei]